MLSRKKIWQKTRTTRCSSSSRGSTTTSDQDIHYDGDNDSCHSTPSTPRSSPRSPLSSSHWNLLEQEGDADNTTTGGGYGSTTTDYNSDDSESEYSTSPHATQNGLIFTSLFTNLPVYNSRPLLKGLQTDGVIIDTSDLPPPSERRRSYNNSINSNNKNDSNNNKSSSSNNNTNKRVKFSLAVKVILIPTRDEFRRLGLFDALFWTHSDFIAFKQEAFNELQSFILTNEYKIKKKAMKRLGVLKNFVDSDDILKYDSLNSQRRRALLFPPTSAKQHQQSSSSAAAASSSSSPRGLRQQLKGSLDNFFKDVNDKDEFVIDDESYNSHDYNCGGDYQSINNNNNNNNLSNDGMMCVSSCNQLKEASVILYQPNEYFETLPDYKEEEEGDEEEATGGGESAKSLRKSSNSTSSGNNSVVNISSSSNNISKVAQSVSAVSKAVAAGDEEEENTKNNINTSSATGEFGLDDHVWHNDNYISRNNNDSNSVINTMTATSTSESCQLKPIVNNVSSISL